MKRQSLSGRLRRVTPAGVIKQTRALIRVCCFLCCAIGQQVIRLCAILQIVLMQSDNMIMRDCPQTVWR